MQYLIPLGFIAVMLYMIFTKPIFEGLKKNIITYFTDTRFIFSKKFITENYWKHFFGIMILGGPFTYFTTEISNMNAVAYVGIGICHALFGFAIGGFFEYFMMKYRDCLFDWTDVRMTSYGALVIYALTILLIIN